MACQICNEECNKLRPCNFLDEEGREAWEHVCMDCAENVRSLPGVLGRSPLIGVAIDLKWAGPQVRTQHCKVYEYRWEDGQPEPPFKISSYSSRHLDNQYAIVSYGEMQFFVNAKKLSPYLNFKFKNGNQMYFADNVFALWSKMKRMFLNPPEDLKPDEVKKIIRKRWQDG